MKNKTQRTISVFLIVLIFAFCGCNRDIINSETESEETSTILESLANCSNIQFDKPHVEVCLISDENYYFSNRNTNVYEKFIDFIKNTLVYSQTVEKPTSNHYYVSINDSINFASFSIYESDIIEIYIGSNRSYYYCKGIYEQFTNTFDFFFTEYGKYCQSVISPITHMHEYAIYDENKNILDYDYITKMPRLFYHSGTVHFWAQAGTGALTRFARFYDTKEGLVSPEYYGQTDFFGDMVCAAASSKVIIYEMYSGKQLLVFDQFEKPLGDCFENIKSAYFSKDGTQIIVEYLNSEFETELQIFKLPINH